MVKSYFSKCINAIVNCELLLIAFNNVNAGYMKNLGRKVYVDHFVQSRTVFDEVVQDLTQRSSDYLQNVDN